MTVSLELEVSLSEFSDVDTVFPEREVVAFVAAVVTEVSFSDFVLSLSALPHAETENTKVSERIAAINLFMIKTPINFQFYRFDYTIFVGICQDKGELFRALYQQERKYIFSSY